MVQQEQQRTEGRNYQANCLHTESPNNTCGHLIWSFCLAWAFSSWCLYIVLCDSVIKDGWMLIHDYDEWHFHWPLCCGLAKSTDHPKVTIWIGTHCIKRCKCCQWLKENVWNRLWHVVHWGDEQAELHQNGWKYNEPLCWQCFKFLREKNEHKSGVITLHLKWFKDTSLVSMAVLSLGNCSPIKEASALFIRHWKSIIFTLSMLKKNLIEYEIP